MMKDVLLNIQVGRSGSHTYMGPQRSAAWGYVERSDVTYPHVRHGLPIGRTFSLPIGQHLELPHRALISYRLSPVTRNTGHQPSRSNASSTWTKLLVRRAFRATALLSALLALGVGVPMTASAEVSARPYSVEAAESSECLRGGRPLPPYNVRVVNETSTAMRGLSGVFSNLTNLPVELAEEQSATFTPCPGEPNIDFRYQLRLHKIEHGFPVGNGVNFEIRVDAKGIHANCFPDVYSPLSCDNHLEKGDPGTKVTTVVFHLQWR